MNRTGNSIEHAKDQVTRNGRSLINCNWISEEAKHTMQLKVDDDRVYNTAEVQPSQPCQGLTARKAKFILLPLFDKVRHGYN